MPNDETDDRNANEQALSKEEIQDYVKRFDKLESEFREMQSQLEPSLNQALIELAGPHLETMLKSKAETVKYLSDPNPKLRAASLRVAYRHWEITDKLATVYENMALCDSDPKVRETALRAVGRCYARSKDQRIGCLLAQVVRNDDLSVDMRLTAFTSLLGLHGNMDYGAEGGKSPLVPESLQDIDWALVEHYYHGWPTP